MTSRQAVQGWKLRLQAALCCPNSEQVNEFVLLMYSRPTEHMVVSLLRQCYNRPICKASRLNAHGNRAISQQHQNFPQARNQAKVLAHVREQAVEGGLRSIERRCFHSTSIGAQNAGQSDRNAERIAVLGGGITGLSTAYHLSREFPRSQITLYEGSERLGGWLRSTPVEVDNGTVVFESGPRTLRWTTPASLTTLEIVSDVVLISRRHY